MRDRSRSRFTIASLCYLLRGEVLPLYSADIDDDGIRILLNELAAEIGKVLEQEEVHVAYRDRTWTLKAGSGILSLDAGS